MFRRSILSVLTASCVLGAFAVFLSFKREAPRRNPSVLASAPVAARRAGEAPRDESKPAAEPSRPATRNDNPPIDYPALFRRSRDYWALAAALLPAAKAGDADAQFYLYRTLDYCDDNNRFYFIRRGQKLSPDEALDWADRRALPREEVKRVHERCSEFLHQDASAFGARAEWLARATELGQPDAQSTTAGKALVQASLNEVSRAGGALPVTKPISPNATPRQLLSYALQSGDPYAMWVISEVQLMLNPSSDDPDEERMAWMLVACRRGYDCSATADWVVASCRSNIGCTAGNNGEDVIQHIAAGKWAAVEQKAEFINDRLDAGDYQALGFGL